MHKQESVLENETLNILWDFKVTNGPPLLDQKTRSSVNNKKSSGEFCCSKEETQSENERKWKTCQIQASFKN